MVLCVHGLTRRATDFDALAQALAAGGWRVICPDMIGRGDSERVSDPMLYSVPQYVADCVTLVARLGVESVDWVGTSMGGLIGMVYAALKGNPIGRLVLNDIGPELDWEGLERIATAVGEVPVFGSYDEGAAWVREHMVSFGPHDEAGWDMLIRPYLEQGKDGGWTAHYDPAIAVPFKALVAGGAAAGGGSMWSMWDAIACPVLVLRGAESDLLSVATAQGMTHRGPPTTLVEFAGVGHAPTLIASDQIAAVIAFLQSPTRAPAINPEELS